MLRKDRLNNLSALGPMTSPNWLGIKEMDKCTQRLRGLNGDRLETGSDVMRMHKTMLNTAVDGAGLSQAADVPQAHAWVGSGTSLLSGRDFVNCVRARINALPTRSRTSRGRPDGDRGCRGGCLASETLNHTVQVCPRTHGARIERHDAVIKYIKRNLRTKGYEVAVEPRLMTTQGDRKPDLVAVRDRKALIIDAQVVTDSVNLQDADSTKREKYSGGDFLSRVKETFRVDETLTMSATLNWRGIWSKSSAKALLEEKVIRTSELSVLSARVLVGTLHCWSVFNRSTARWHGVNAGRMIRPRTGIG